MAFESSIHYTNMTMNGFRRCAFCFSFSFFFVSMTNQKVGEAVIEVVGLEEPLKTRSHFLSEDHSAVHSVFLPLLYSEK